MPRYLSFSPSVTLLSLTDANVSVARFLPRCSFATLRLCRVKVEAKGGGGVIKMLRLFQ